jgi:hypothetical protein
LLRLAKQRERISGFQLGELGASPRTITFSVGLKLSARISSTSRLKSADADN